ncbi:MAG TPA: stage III sporulation protein AA [Clostridiaceae bacterium]|nr:stage III sporulation protein AA [Clostridiaceae bacterium]
MGQQNNRIEGLDMLLSTYFPDRIRKAVKGIRSDYTKYLEEIRIRSGLPLMGVFSGCDYFISQEGVLLHSHESALNITAKEVNSLFLLLCEQSIYAYQDEIIRGFITLKGGHRAGICGTVVYEGNRIKAIKDISSINIRFSRQVEGCAQDIFQQLIRNRQDIYNTLILSPPGCGKTTILRDLCRLISQGLDNNRFKGLRTAVIDERSELAASFRGVPQNDLGPRTDVLDGCRKSQGIEIMLRGMAPQVIIVDELGAKEDADAIQMAWNAGVRIIATAHAFGLEDFKRRLGVGQLAAKDGFERIVLLGMENGKRWTRVISVNGDEHSGMAKDYWMSDGFFRMRSYGNENVIQACRETACAGKTHRNPT